MRAAAVTVVFAADMESSKLTDRVVRLAVEGGAPRAFTDNLPMYISMFGGGHQSALVRNAAYGLKAGLLNAVRPMLPTPPKAPSINAPEAWCVVCLATGFSPRALTENSSTKRESLVCH